MWKRIPKNIISFLIFKLIIYLIFKYKPLKKRQTIEQMNDDELQ